MDLIPILGTPAASGAIVWYLITKYFERQAIVLKEISDGMQDLKTRVAVHESRTALLEETRKDYATLRDDMTRAKASLEAAWRILDARKS